MNSITTVDVLVVERCITCGIQFGVPQSYQNRRKNDHKDFCCPNGHKQYYPGKSDEERLRDELKAKENELQNARSYYQGQISGLKNNIRVQKGLKTKMLNRIKNGVCPCCNRQFKDLQRHFHSKHPELL